MKTVFSETEIIEFFESWISNLTNSQDRELLLNYIQEFFQTIEDSLSDKAKDYLDRIIKDSQKK